MTAAVLVMQTPVIDCPLHTMTTTPAKLSPVSHQVQMPGSVLPEEKANLLSKWAGETGKTVWQVHPLSSMNCKEG